MNLLFTSAGRRVSLIRSFRKALKDLAIDGKIFTTDLRKDAPANFVADGHFKLPRVTEPNYINELRELCKKNKIKLVIPTIDTELSILAKHRDEFRKEGVTILVCGVSDNEISFDKFDTDLFFKKNYIPTPKTYHPHEVPLDGPYPIFLKPARGSCSIGVQKIHDKEELDFFSKRTDRPLLQEYIKGKEFTIDVLCDFDGKPRCAVPRLRIETRAGEISKGVTIKNQQIIDAAMNVVTKFDSPRGCITLQCFVTDDNKIYFIEINPRFGGGVPLSIAAGANYPKWILEWMLGKNPVVNNDCWKENTVMLRFDEEIITDWQTIS